MDNGNLRAALIGGNRYSLVGLGGQRGQREYRKDYL